MRWRGSITTCPRPSARARRLQVYLRVVNAGTRHWHAHHPEGRWVELLVYLGDDAATEHEAAQGRAARRGGPAHDSLSHSRQSRTTATGPSRCRSSSSRWPGSTSTGWHRWSSTCASKSRRRERWPTPTPSPANRMAGCGCQSAGITRSRTGRPYPTFIEHAQGCRVRDPDGNEWIDYVMAGGAAVLGYAHPEVQAAIARQLASSAVVTLPHMLEVTVNPDAVRRDPVCRDGAVRQTRIGQLHGSRPHRAPAHGTQEGPVQRIPRLARLVRVDAPAEAGESIAGLRSCSASTSTTWRPSTQSSRRTAARLPR